MTPWQKHKAKWQGCEKCTLCKKRNEVVLARGNIPCNILFIGEAPGHSENVIGKPFIGPAGNLMQRIIDHSLPKGCSYALTNLVACIPLGEDNNKLQEPLEKCIKACQPRLEEFIWLADPRLMILVGRFAEGLPPVPTQQPVEKVSIKHPAAMLRMDPAKKSLEIQRAEATISDAVSDALR